MDVFLFTIMNTGTRSVRAFYQNQGHNVAYMHAMPEAMWYLEDAEHRVSTIRNPYDVANSWLKGPSPRFNSCNWKQQWLLWKEAVTTFEFDKIHVMESFYEPVVGEDSRQIIFDIPNNLKQNIQFALDVLKDSGIEHPNYGDDS